MARAVASPCDAGARSAATSHFPSIVFDPLTYAIEHWFRAIAVESDRRGLFVRSLHFRVFFRPRWRYLT